MTRSKNTKLQKQCMETYSYSFTVLCLDFDQSCIKITETVDKHLFFLGLENILLGTKYFLLDL